MTTEHERRTYLSALLAAFSLVAVWAAIAPLDRGAWALENGLVLAGFVVLVATHKTLPLSRVSYTLIFVFLCFHEVGSHYTYAKVPYESWFQSLFGSSPGEWLGSERNYYDRLVHFLYGLLLAYPIREVVLRVVDAKGFWGYFLPLDVTMSTSMIYELIEWSATMVFKGETGMVFLATQGDMWDAHKDMLLASGGALLAMIFIALVNWHMQHDFAREWAHSLRVKRPRPLGEDAIARMGKNRK